MEYHAARRKYAISGRGCCETCRIEAGDKQMTVNMGQISSNRFHAVGEDRAPVPFVIHLRECGTVVSERVGVAFHGAADGKNPGCAFRGRRARDSHQYWRSVV